MVSGQHLDDNRHKLAADTWEHAQQADIGEYVREAAPSTADTSGVGGRIGESDKGEYVKEGGGLPLPSSTDIQG